MVTPAAGGFRPDRRSLLTAAGLAFAAGLLPGPGRSAAPQPRLAAIDWAMLETAVAIGHMPVAACELIRFREDAGDVALAPQMVDLGLRGAPNFELLQLVRPGLILNSPYYAANEARFGAIAPVLSLTFFTPGEPPLPKALAALGDLARAVGDPAAGGRALAASEAAFDTLTARLAPFADRPFALINIGDARHVRIFGHDSLFGSTLVRLGLTNAWTEGTRFSFLAPVPLERLVTMPEARLVIVGRPSPEVQRGLDRSVLWRALPPVAAGRVHHLADANAFGAVPAALSFARALADALAGEAG